VAPRLRDRATTRRFTAAAGELLAALLEDARLVLAGTSAARLHGWELPAGDWPIEAYVREEDLVGLVEQCELDRVGEADVGDVVLRSIPAPWPFPPHARLAPPLVTALDLSESSHSALRALGEAQLVLLMPDPSDAVSWQRRRRRRQMLQPIVPTGPMRRPAGAGRVVVPDAAPELWDDRAERDAGHLVALLYVEAQPVRRATLAESLHISPARLERACAFLRALPPHGLALLEDTDRLGLATAPDCADVVEQHLKVQRPEPLSQAALEALAVVAYEQPVSRADISSIRGTDSTGLVDTLLARGLIAVDPRFGGRGRPSFLVTTEQFLRHMGLSSLEALPPRPLPTSP
jgi:segregation and condensation protein B